MSKLEKNKKGFHAVADFQAHKCVVITLDGLADFLNIRLIKGVFQL